MMACYMEGVKEPRRNKAMKKPPFPAPPGKKWVYKKWFIHYITGKKVYPKKAECFCFLVNA